MASISAAFAVFRLPLHRPPTRSPPRLQVTLSLFPSSLHQDLEIYELLLSYPATVMQRAVAAWSFKCRAGPPPQEASEKSSLLGIPTSTWAAGLGGLGFLETAYLTYLKFSGGEAFCPVAGGSCSDVLNSDFSAAFGLPLPLIGMLAYGSVALLSLKQSGKNLFPGLGETDARLILIVTTTSMATASAYFLYILSTQFAGTTCSYCLLSAVLSFSLFFINLKDIGLEEIRNTLGLQLAIALFVVTALTNTYSIADTKSPSTSDITLERYETEITTQSTPFALSLAKHLHSIGAKMYGAFWCSHCNEQKQMFGREAAKILDYVECFPNGAGKGRTMALECAAVGIEGFPTWVIEDKIISGEQDLQALAEASRYNAEESRPS